jgi:hypothetical protein
MAIAVQSRCFAYRVGDKYGSMEEWKNGSETLINFFTNTFILPFFHTFIL